MSQNTKSFKLPALSTISYIISSVFIGIGLYKIQVYKNSEYGFDTINAYVGGDAYNYIINSNYAGAYFTLALIFVLVGSTIAIIGAITWSADQSNRVIPSTQDAQSNPDNFEDLPPL